jgi:ferritin-like metal-binding protein YciE
MEEVMAGKDLRELFHETLKDIYFAEKKILGALPKMAKAAQSPDLKRAFEKHETETEEHVNRLEQVFAELEASPRGKTCDAIMGIIEEGQEVMKEFKGMPALDAGLLAAAQAVEHYEMARYGTLKTWAAELGHAVHPVLRDFEIRSRFWPWRRTILHFRHEALPPPGPRQYVADVATVGSGLAQGESTPQVATFANDNIGS